MICEMGDLNEKTGQWKACGLPAKHFFIDIMPLPNSGRAYCCCEIHVATVYNRAFDKAITENEFLVLSVMES